MSNAKPISSRGGILVTDFDGTLTRHDFYQLALLDLLPDERPDIWGDYCAGRITHFEALQQMFALIRKPERAVREVLARAELEATLPTLLARLREAGWKVIVASAGCEWYIRILLGEVAHTLEIHANPGRYVEGEGLLLELPRQSRYFSLSHGIDKAKIVRTALASCQRVAFAGDGYPDMAAARLVQPEYRFARAALAEALRQEKLPFHPFERWREVALTLLAEENPPALPVSPPTGTASDRAEPHLGQKRS